MILEIPVDLISAGQPSAELQVLVESIPDNSSKKSCKVIIVIAFMVCLISVPKFRTIKDRLITPKSKPNIINGLQVNPQKYVWDGGKEDHIVFPC